MISLAALPLHFCRSAPCHRYLFEWETGRPYITPTIFSGTAGNTPPPPGPARLPNPWSFGGPASDNDGAYRSGSEVSKALSRHLIVTRSLATITTQIFPCNFTGACLPSPCVYDYSRQSANGDLFTIGADSNGNNPFIGDILETFRFQLFSNTMAYPLFAAATTSIMPYLQVSARLGLGSGAGMVYIWLSDSGQVLLELPIRSQSDLQLEFACGLRFVRRPFSRGRRLCCLLRVGLWRTCIRVTESHMHRGTVDGGHGRLCWPTGLCHIVPGDLPPGERRDLLPRSGTASIREVSL